jgi:hypothetical protein
VNPSSHIALSADHTMTPEKFSGLETPLAWSAIECEPEAPIQHDWKRGHKLANIIAGVPVALAVGTAIFTVAELRRDHLVFPLIHFSFRIRTASWPLTTALTVAGYHRLPPCAVGRSDGDRRA